MPSGLLVVRQQQAHERVLYERFLKEMDAKNRKNVQKLLFPERFSFPKHHVLLLKELQEDISALGFSFSVGQDNTFLVVKGVPLGIPKVDCRDLFEQFIKQYQDNEAVLSLGRSENVAAAMARRLRLQEGLTLSQEEAYAIMEDLYLCKNTRYTPSGEPITHIITLSALGDFFRTKR